jgi:hypothetical protein
MSRSKVPPQLNTYRMTNLISHLEHTVTVKFGLRVKMNTL